MLLIGFPMTSIIAGIKVLTRRGERRMPKIGAHEPQVNLLVCHMRSGAMPQPMRRCLFELIGPGRTCFTAGTQCVGCTAEDPLFDRREGCAHRVKAMRRKPRSTWHLDETFASWRTVSATAGD
jgi:hypothetical protein